VWNAFASLCKGTLWRYCSYNRTMGTEEEGTGYRVGYSVVIMLEIRIHCLVFSLFGVRASLGKWRLEACINLAKDGNAKLKVRFRQARGVLYSDIVREC
jgi:hypothetical protein